MATNLTVALVGLRFGAEFAPIYQAHPDVSTLVLCDTDANVLRTVSDRLQVSDRAATLEEVLERTDIDAVHLVTPLGHHGVGSADVLRSDKHCASTVPMAFTVEELREIVALQHSTGKNYMMMETAVYTREFLHVQALYQAGEFGPLSFASGAHYQDMAHWPSYWSGLPPMWYMTHAISPILHLLDTGARRVRCVGSGCLPGEREARYGNPYPAESAIFELEGSEVAVSVSRTLFQSARSYTESFAIYGERRGFEWPQLEDEDPVHFLVQPPDATGHRPIIAERLPAPDRPDLLPPEIARFTRSSVFEDGSHLSFVQGGGHGGSHPHLVHEFVRSIVEERRPSIDAVTAARWTAAGITAHEAAMTGHTLEIPDFRS